MKNSNHQVTVTLARLPTLADYKRCGLCSGSDDEIKAFGDHIVNALMPQFNDNLRVEYKGDPANSDVKASGMAVVFFECDVDGLEGSWYFPADLFDVRFDLDLKD